MLVLTMIGVVEFLGVHELHNLFRSARFPGFDVSLLPGSDVLMVIVFVAQRFHT